ncbi:hypothetical protein CCMSSC00406_0009644 [Pleurotus cornucopiae]|uniref:Uncharacterized protein n=1 Tax=Pleurotus cornucopiae TaxID=5321 RepID=A0ACB7J962_PLECO|nr:hypothetical protein CCMSSC00406_0009644 [Pleurotus cornucopiae]
MSLPTTENEVVHVPATDNIVGTSLKPASISIPIRPGFSFTVRGTVKSNFYQQVPIKLVTNGRTSSGVTFAGHGMGLPMKVKSSGANEWSAQASPLKRSLELNIVHGQSDKGPWVQSKVAKPIEIKKSPEDGKIHQKFYFTIILSEDWVDNDYDDAVITVIQWK